MLMVFLELNLLCHYHIACCVILYAFYRLLIFLKINFSPKEIMSTIGVSSRLDPDQADILSGLIWVQTDCKFYLSL